MSNVDRVRDLCLWVFLVLAGFAFVDSTLQDMTRNDCEAGIQRACAHVRSQAR
jgi:hypothetical protein